MIDHKTKMQLKAFKRERAYKRDHEPNPYIPANLGVNHPDYGMSVKDHAVEKEGRDSQKSY